MPPNRSSLLLRAGVVLIVVLVVVTGGMYVAGVGPFAGSTALPTPIGNSAPPLSTGTPVSVPATAAPPTQPPATPPTGVNPIITENQHAGTAGWALNGPVSSDLKNEIKGYADEVSINRGGTIDFKVTVNPVQAFTIAIYRLGWYGGLGGRLMASIGPLIGVTQPACPMDPVTRMVACAWSTSYTLDVPAGWMSGAYVAKLQNGQGYQNYISFVVRDDTSHSAIVVQSATNTWEAYNKWGGSALYPPGLTHAVKVSFDRPYDGIGTSFTTSEVQFIHFIEREGFDVTYMTDLDTHESGQLILNHRAFVSMGHDEYWSWQMRDVVEGARDKGVNLAFFGGNDSYWQVRYEPSASGAADRVMVGYKEEFVRDPNYASRDPSVRARTTDQWRSPVVNRPEQLMMGLMYSNNLGPGGDLPYVVENADNWVYAGTGVSDGEQLTRMVGREYDSVQIGYPLPAYKSFTILAQTTDPRTGTRGNTVVYQASSGAWVFAAGTMDWAWALDSYGGHNDVSAALQQATINILARFSG